MTVVPGGDASASNATTFVRAGSSRSALAGYLAHAGNECVQLVLARGWSGAYRVEVYRQSILGPIVAAVPHETMAEAASMLVDIVWAENTVYCWCEDPALEEAVLEAGPSRIGRRWTVSHELTEVEGGPVGDAEIRKALAGHVPAHLAEHAAHVMFATDADFEIPLGAAVGFTISTKDAGHECHVTYGGKTVCLFGRTTDALTRRDVSTVEDAAPILTSHVYADARVRGAADPVFVSTYHFTAPPGLWKVLSKFGNRDILGGVSKDQ